MTMLKKFWRWKKDIQKTRHQNDSFTRLKVKDKKQHLQISGEKYFQVGIPTLQTLNQMRCGKREILGAERSNLPLLPCFLRNLRAWTLPSQELNQAGMSSGSREPKRRKEKGIPQERLGDGRVPPLHGTQPTWQQEVRGPIRMSPGKTQN